MNILIMAIPQKPPQKSGFFVAMCGVVLLKPIFAQINLSLAVFPATEEDDSVTILMCLPTG